MIQTRGLVINGAVLLLGALSIASVAALEQPPEGGAPREYRLPEVQTYGLDNGLQVTLVPFGRVPKVSISVIVRAGNLDEGNDTWLADLTGAMLKEGTTRRSARQMALDAAAMGSGIGVRVGVHQTSISADVLTDSAGGMLRLIGETILSPALPEDELPRIRQNLQRSLSVALTQPQNLASQAFRALLYGDHPYGRIFPSSEQLDAYDIYRVRDFHRANFGAARTHIYVAGRFDVAEMTAAIQDVFADWQPGPAPAEINTAPSQRLRVRLIDRPGAPQSTIYIGAPVADPSDPDRVALGLTNTLLGGYFSSRMTANLREDKGYAYSPRSRLSHRYRDSYWLQVADVTTAATGAALNEIVSELDMLRREPPGRDELRRAQNYRTGTFVLGNATRGGLIGQLAFLDLHRLPLSTLNSYVADIHAVTAADVQRIATTYLDPARMTIAIVGDLELVRPQLRDVALLSGVEPE